MMYVEINVGLNSIQFVFVSVCMDVFMIGCGVVAAIEQWTPQGNFNRYNAPHPPHKGIL